MALRSLAFPIPTSVLRHFWEIILPKKFISVALFELFELFERFDFFASSDSTDIVNLDVQNPCSIAGIPMWPTKLLYMLVVWWHISICKVQGCPGAIWKVPKTPWEMVGPPWWYTGQSISWRHLSCVDLFVPLGCYDTTISYSKNSLLQKNILFKLITGTVAWISVEHSSNSPSWRTIILELSRFDDSFVCRPLRPLGVIVWPFFLGWFTNWLNLLGKSCLCSWLKFFPSKIQSSCRKLLMILGALWKWRVAVRLVQLCPEHACWRVCHSPLRGWLPHPFLTFTPEEVWLFGRSTLGRCCR